MKNSPPFFVKNKNACNFVDCAFVAKRYIKIIMKKEEYNAPDVKVVMAKPRTSILTVSGELPDPEEV